MLWSLLPSIRGGSFVGAFFVKDRSSCPAAIQVLLLVAVLFTRLPPAAADPQGIEP